MSKMKKSLIAVAVLLVLALGALGLWSQFHPVAQPGGKNIVFEVVDGDECR